MASVTDRVDVQSAPELDWNEHYRTYRSFVKYTTLFAAHVAIILLLLGYFLA